MAKDDRAPGMKSAYELALERHPLVEADQLALVGIGVGVVGVDADVEQVVLGRLVLDDDRDVVEQRRELLGQAVERLGHQLLEAVFRDADRHLCGLPGRRGRPGRPTARRGFYDRGRRTAARRVGSPVVALVKYLPRSVS